MTRQLPDSWCFAPLSDLVEINPGIDKAQFQDSAEVPFVPMPAVEAETGRIDVSGRRPFAEVKSGFTSFASGDVLFAKITPCMENGKMAVVPDLPSGVGFGSTEFFVLRPTAAVNAKLLYYFVSSAAFRQEAQHHMTGAVGQKRVPKRYLESVRFPVPPIKEQSRIVEKIETLFAELDKGEESLRQVQTLLARYRQSVLKAAVTGELTADWRARHAGKLEHGRDLLARILKARRENWQGRGKYKEPVEPDTANLLELPDGWVWASLSQITWIKGGITVDKKRNPTNPITLPYLRVANVQNGYLDLSHVREITVEAEKAEECLLKPGDILLNEGGDRDKLGRGWVWSGEIERCIHQNHVFRARPVLAELSSKFVSFYANAFGQPFFMQKGKQSVNLASISLTAISGLPIPLPPVEEQREIVELLEDKLGEIGQLEKACEHELSRSSALRRSVLRHAFAGKLVPQDLNDEPASKLLERIRSQRETANCKTTREAVTA